MQPRKDYDDYTRFINDTYSGEKEKMLTNTVSFEHKRGTFTKNYNPLHTLRTYSEFGLSNSKTLNNGGFKPNSRGGHQRNHSTVMAGSAVEKRMGSTFTEFDVKPKLLESKIAQRDDFFNLSDGFKKIFAKDKPD